MGRDVKARMGNYNADATVLMRIAKAISQDATVTSAWRERAVARLRAAIQDLLNPEEVPSVMGRTGRGKSGGQEEG